MKQSTRIGDDLYLSPLRTDDAPILFDLVEKNRSHLREWLPWLDSNTSVADSMAFVKRALAQESEGKVLVRTISYRSSICGVIGFNSIDAINRTCQIGYWLDAQHQGRGIVTKSTKALTNFAFAELNLNKVSIPVAEHNRKSRAIPESLGFTVEGTAREAEWLYDHYVNHVLYAMLKSEWIY